MTPQPRQADIVLGKFRSKGLRESHLVRLLGWPRGRFQYAKRVGHFRQKDHLQLLAVARENDVDLIADDFIAHLRTGS